MVATVARNGTRFHATLDNGDEISARNIVVATGITGMAHVPPELRELLGNGVSHSSEHVNVSSVGSDVTIVGAGQSALELAALLIEDGSSAQVLVRRREVQWNPYPLLERSIAQRVRGPRAPLGDGWKLAAYSYGAHYFRHLPYERRIRLVWGTLGPAGAWWLRDRLQPRSVLRLDRRVLAAGIADGRIKLRLAVGDGRTEEIHTNHVVAATGYRIDIRRLAFLNHGLSANIATRGGAPILSRGFESSVPGLFFVGLHAAPTFGPVMRFVCGSAVAATRVTRTLVQRQ
jgi:cation diffusion facilitator CzcD-associated flavoprotein CzcO